MILILLLRFLIQTFACVELFLADYSEQWKADKKFAMVNLRKFGFGVPSLEPSIQEHIAKLIAKFKSYDGAAFEGKPLLKRSLAEIIVPIVLTGGFFCNL